MAENDPKLHTIEGIQALLEESVGEMGISIEWGWVLLGSVYRPVRELDTLSDMPDVRNMRRNDHVELWGTISVDECQVRMLLIADAQRSLKPGQRFELRRKMPSNFGRTQGMCWYRNDAMDKREKWGEVFARPGVPRDGYMLVGEYTVPTL